MIDPNKVTEAVMEFMQNPTWKEIFTNAPGGAMERLAISFYFSKFHDQFQPEDFQEYRDLRDEYEKSMTEEDLNYLIENSDKDNAKKHYQELLANLQQSGGQPQGNMRFEKEEKAVEAENTEQGAEKVEEKVEETVKEGDDGEEKVEESATVTAEEKAPSKDEELPPIDNTFAQQDDGDKEPPADNGKEDLEKPAAEENKEQDEKYNTALSVALNYLQNEEKKMGETEDDEKKK